MKVDHDEQVSQLFSKPLINIGITEKKCVFKLISDNKDA
jgi:hypothetical protein